MEAYEQAFLNNHLMLLGQLIAKVIVDETFPLNYEKDTEVWLKACNAILRKEIEHMIPICRERKHRQTMWNNRK